MSSNTTTTSLYSRLIPCQDFLSNSHCWREECPFNHDLAMLSIVFPNEPVCKTYIQRQSNAESSRDREASPPHHLQDGIPLKLNVRDRCAVCQDDLPSHGAGSARVPSSSGAADHIHELSTCHHRFHYKCISDWAKFSSTKAHCPLCRTEFRHEEVNATQPSVSVFNVLAALISDSGDGDATSVAHTANGDDDSNHGDDEDDNYYTFDNDGNDQDTETDVTDEDTTDDNADSELNDTDDDSSTTDEYSHSEEDSSDEDSTAYEDSTSYEDSKSDIFRTLGGLLQFGQDQ